MSRRTPKKSPADILREQLEEAAEKARIYSAANDGPLVKPVGVALELPKVTEPTEPDPTKFEPEESTEPAEPSEKTAGGGGG